MIGFDAQKKNILQAYAAIKKVPFGKVIRNAARDVVQYAFEHTPVSRKKKSDYYWYIDSKNRRHYLHFSQLSKVVKNGGVTKTGKRRNVSLKNYISRQSKLHKVKMYTSWMRAKWIGAMRMLGMQTKRAGAYDTEAANYSTATMHLNDAKPQVTIIANMKFDGLVGVESALIAGGLDLAWERVTNDMARILERAWR